MKKIFLTLMKTGLIAVVMISFGAGVLPAAVVGGEGGEPGGLAGLAGQEEDGEVAEGQGLDHRGDGPARDGDDAGLDLRVLERELAVSQHPRREGPVLRSLPPPTQDVVEGQELERCEDLPADTAVHVHLVELAILLRDLHLHVGRAEEDGDRRRRHGRRPV